MPRQLVGDAGQAVQHSARSGQAAAERRGHPERIGRADHAARMAAPGTSTCHVAQVNMSFCTLMCWL